MLLVLCLAVIIVGTFADQLSQTLNSKCFIDGQGNYEFQVRTSDGISRWQTGRLRYSGDKPYTHVEEGYSYLDHWQGVKRVVTFVADQNMNNPTISQNSFTITPSQFEGEAFPSQFGGTSGGTGPPRFMSAASG